jgi:hypothetical protein
MIAAPKTLSESIEIMSSMASDRYIDYHLFELFLRSGVCRQYARTYLQHLQLDGSMLGRTSGREISQQVLEVLRQMRMGETTA